MCIKNALSGFYCVIFKGILVYDQKLYRKWKIKNEIKYIIMLTHSYKKLNAVAKIRKIEGYERMSEDELLQAPEESENSKPPKTIKETRKKTYDSDKIIRNKNQKGLKALLMIIMSNMKAMGIKIKVYLSKSILLLLDHI